LTLHTERFSSNIRLKLIAGIKAFAWRSAALPVSRNRFLPAYIELFSGKADTSATGLSTASKHDQHIPHLHNAGLCTMAKKIIGLSFLSYNGCREAPTSTRSFSLRAKIAVIMDHWVTKDAQPEFLIGYMPVEL
jgi:hypothetical protein